MPDRKMIFTILLAGVGYWLLDSVIDAFLFREGSFISQLYSQSPHDLFMRAMITALLGVTAYAVLIISKQKKTEHVMRTGEELLRASEEKYRSLVDSIGMSIVLIGPTMEILSVNKTTRDMFPDVDFDNKPQCYQTFNLPSMEQPCSYCAAIKSFQDGKTHETVTETPTPHGIRNFRIVTTPVKDAAGRVSAVIEMAEDVTEQKQAEKALIRSKLLLQKTFDSINDVMMLVTIGTRTIIDINEAGARTFGYGREEMIGKTTEHLFANHIAFLNLGKRFFSSLAQTGLFQGETEMIRKNGEIFPAEFIISEIPGEYDSEKYTVGVIRDITERVRIEHALKSSEKKYRSLVENALVGVYQSTIDGRFLYTNDTHARIMGYSSAKEMLAENILKLYKTPADREQLINTLKQTGRILSYEIESPAKNGEIKTVQISATLDGDIISGLVMDITGQKKLEEQLRQAQKMEAIGQLAGGVAHDFNNILSAIVGYSHMTLMKMKAEDPLRMNIDHVMEAADRAATLTHSLLAFSRKQTIRLKPVNLNELLRRFDKFILRLIREDIELKTTLVDAELTVMADSTQIEQALMNLVTNARDAMPSGGRLAIKTGLTALDEERAEAFGYSSPGDYAFISVEDTGIGMNHETVEKVFEPFFTTKEIGKGTGLGLAMVYGIIKQHSGHVNVESESGKGTTFIIYLPIYNRALQKIEGEECTKNLPAKGGSETLLIAEDDAALRKLSTILLRQSGYNVIEASDGQEALNLFIEHKDKIKLSVLDAIMPRKNGREVYEEMKKLQPGIRAILVSGYTADIFGKDGIVDSEITFMAKPVMPSDLLNKIRELLDVIDVTV